MPFNSSVRGVHINEPLSNLSIGYHPAGMVAEQIFPVLPVKHESDDYYRWDKGSAFRLERPDGRAFRRADGTASKELNFGATIDQYHAEEDALKTKITDRERANADIPLQLEVSKTRRVQDLLLLALEARIATALTTVGNYASSNVATLSGNSQWNNANFTGIYNGYSVIEKNIDDGREAVRIATGGHEPNTIIIPRAVARVMKRDAGIREEIKFTNPDILVGGELPPVLWGLRVVSPSSVYDSSVEGDNSSLIDVWGKNVIIAYIEPNPSLDCLTLGMIFRARPWQIKQWRDEEIESTMYEASVVEDEKLVASDCGFLLQSVIA